MQLTIFAQIHTRENSRANEAILKANEPRLSNNCQKLLDAMLNGSRLSGIDCINLGMTEYRRRFKDLIDAGYPVQSEMVGGSKRWFIKIE